MTIFETIKVEIPVGQAAEHYGLKVNRNSMACCLLFKGKESKAIEAKIDAAEK